MKPDPYFHARSYLLPRPLVPCRLCAGWAMKTTDPRATPLCARCARELAAHDREAEAAERDDARRVVA